MPLRFDEVQTLPYAILEIKTQADPPSWVTELKNSGYLIPAAHFSKFLYGSCKLWPEKMDHTPDWWDTLTNLDSSILLIYLYKSLSLFFLFLCLSISYLFAAIPRTPAMATLHERISHFSHFLGGKHISTSPPYSQKQISLPSSSPLSSKKPVHKKVVEKVYGSSNFLRRSMEILESRTGDNNNNNDNLVVTEKKNKMVESYYNNAPKHTILQIEEIPEEEKEEKNNHKRRNIMRPITRRFRNRREGRKKDKGDEPPPEKPVFSKRQAQKETSEQVSN